MGVAATAPEQRAIVADAANATKITVFLADRCGCPPPGTVGREEVPIFTVKIRREQGNIIAADDTLVSSIVGEQVDFMRDDAFHTDRTRDLRQEFFVERIADSRLGVITAVSELHASPGVFGDDSRGIFAVVEDNILTSADFDCCAKRDLAKGGTGCLFVDGVCVHGNSSFTDTV